MKSLLSQIKYAHYDGSDVTTVVSNVANPVAITVYGNYIYYSDTVLELIERADKNNGSADVSPHVFHAFQTIL